MNTLKQSSTTAEGSNTIVLVLQVVLVVFINFLYGAAVAT